MRRAIVLSVFLLIVVVGVSVGERGDIVPPPVVLLPLPVGDPKNAVITLLDDDAHLLVPYLTNDEDYNGRGAQAATEDLDVFAGVSALRVGPL